MRLHHVGIEQLHLGSASPTKALRERALKRESLRNFARHQSGLRSSALNAHQLKALEVREANLEHAHRQTQIRSPHSLSHPLTQSGRPSLDRLLEQISKDPALLHASHEDIDREDVLALLGNSDCFAKASQSRGLRREPASRP